MKPLYVLTPLACLFTLFALAQDPTTNATAYNSPPSINMMGAGSKHKISVKKAPLWKKARTFRRCTSSTDMPGAETRASRYGYQWRNRF